MDDGLLEARAYNNSIYLMVATPYVLLGGLGLAFVGVTIRGKRSQTRPPEQRSSDQ